jgi:N-[(2S)-2-amino-2-carboxyethyl]-L-glutamate dehydrogenase
MDRWFSTKPKALWHAAGNGFFILNDAQTGFPLALMDCTLLSAMRTGAVTGVGAEILARPDSKTVAMIGAGVQARTQIEAIKVAVPGIKEVRAYDIRMETALEYANEVQRNIGIKAFAVSTPEEAVRGADIIVTVTVADEPIVKEAWMKSGSFFSAVGSYQEEEFEVVQNSDRVVVDGLEHVLHRETPVIALMIKNGMLKKDDVIELGAILCGERPGRVSPDERIFFSPIGMGTEDLCISNHVFQKALEKGMGQKLTLFGTK